MGIYFGEFNTGPYRIAIHCIDDMAAAEGFCFGEVEKGIGPAFDLQPFHQYAPFVSLRQIG